MKSKKEIASLLEKALLEKDPTTREALIAQAETDLHELVSSKEPIEKNEYIQSLYSGLGGLTKGLGAVAKTFTPIGPIMEVATPLTEGARIGLRKLKPDAQYDTPEPNPMAEIESGFNVSDRAGFGLVLQDIVSALGGKNTGLPVPEDMEKEFPELSSMIMEITKPANIASGLVDYMLGSKVAKLTDKKEFAGIKPRTTSSKTAMEYLKSISRDNKLMLDMLKEKENYNLLSPERRKNLPKPRIDRIVELIKNNPDKYLKEINPQELFGVLQEDLKGLREQQIELVENMPKTKFTDAEDFQRLALSKVINEEAGQSESARKIIKKNIPFEDIDNIVIESIDKINELTKRIKETKRKEGSLRNQLVNELEIEKNSLINTINNEPDLKNNPKFDKVLNWLGSLEAVESTADIYPKKYGTNTGESFFREMDAFLSDKFKGRTISKDDALNALLEFYKKNQNKTQTSAEGLEGVAFSPRDSKWTGLLKNVKNDKILPLIEGAGKELELIPNDSKQLLIEKSIERISEINNELRDLSNAKTKSGRNASYLKLIDERRGLEKNLSNIKRNMQEKFGRIYSEAEDYVADIDKRNEVTPQYISKKRQLGNKLKSDYATMPAIDQKPLSIAGSAIESAASEIQDVIMAGSNEADFNIYKDINREMSTKIPFRNLVEKNLLDDGGMLHIPVDRATGRSGVIETARQMGPRYIRPFASRAKYGMKTFLQTPNVISDNLGIINAVPEPMSFREKAETVRAPQSEPVALALASYEIPRNSKKILEESDLVLAKLAQNTTTPEGQVLFDAVHDAIKNNPSKIPSLMKVLSEQSPGIFQHSESNSFDNVVPEAMRKNVLKKINNSKQLSNLQKAKKIQMLINEGYYDEFAKD